MVITITSTSQTLEAILVANTANLRTVLTNLANILEPQIKIANIGADTIYYSIDSTASATAGVSSKILPNTEIVFTLRNLARINLISSAASTPTNLEIL